MEYDIPLFDLNYDEREEAAVLATLRSKWISMGPKCEEFETLFARMTGARHAIALSNCTDALHLACHVLGLEEGDEVLCPSLTFAATVNAIRYVRATPVFCDIQGPDDLNLSADDLESRITPRTRAIVVMHYAGFPNDMDRICAIAAAHDLRIIEDACHGPLSEYKGRKLGTIGDVGCFSFFSNKNVSTGEGGMMITNRDDVAARARLLRSHGMTTMSYQRSKGHATAYDIVDIGFNYRMDDIRASLGIVQMEKLPVDLAGRARIRALYMAKLDGIAGIHIPFRAHPGFVSNYILPIVLRDSTVEKRDHVRDRLKSDGIQTSIHYPAVHRFSAYGGARIDLPNTEYAADNELTLPMYSSLKDEEVAYICSRVKESLSE